MKRPWRRPGPSCSGARLLRSRSRHRGGRSDPECADRVGTATIERFGRIDVLVNNAAVPGADRGASKDVDWLEWMKALHVNLFGSVLMVRTVLPAMRARCKGRSSSCRAVARRAENR